MATTSTARIVIKRVSIWADRARRLLFRGSLLLACGLTLVACGGGGDATGGAGAGNSNPAPVAVITVQPADRSTVEGGAVSFVAAASNASAWQWQSSSDGGRTWADIAAATAASYTTPAATLAMNGQQFRVTVRGAGGDVLTSSAAQLVVTPGLQAAVITVQPQAQAVVAGTGANFSVTATGSALAYVWQTSSDGSNWSDLPVPSTATYPLASTTLADSGKQFRVQVGNSLGTVVSASALLTVSPAPAAPAFGNGPANQAVTVGSPAVFSVQVLGTPVPALRWQQSDDGGSTWADVPGATSSTLTLANVALSVNGRRLRVVASNSVGSATSGAALLSVSAQAQAPTFTLSPVSTRAALGSMLTLTARATGVPMPSLQWQTAASGSAAFASINGATGDSYLTPPLDISDHGRQWRVVASSSAGTAISAAAYVDLYTAPAVRISEPTLSNAMVLAGNTLTIRTEATGIPTPTFIWSQSKNGAPLAVVAGATSSAFTTPAIGQGEAWLFAVDVRNAVGNAVASIRVTGVAPSAPSIGNVYNDAVLVGSPATLRTDLSAGLPAATLQWQSSADGGATWANVPGATSPALTLATTTLADHNRQFRLVASNSAGTVTSAATTLTVSADPVGPAFPPLSVSLPNKGVLTAGTTDAVATHDPNQVLGVPKPTLTESTSRDGGATWQPRNAATAPAWTLADDRILWRRVLSNSAGSVTSLPVRLRVAPADGASWTAWPADIAVQEGSLARFTAGVLNVAGELPTHYEWQVSADGGAIWTAVTAQAGGYAGPEHLQTAPVALQDNGKLFRVRVTGGGKTVTSGNARLTVLPAAEPVLVALAGNAGGLGTRDGPAADARMRFPRSLTRDATGNTYFLDPEFREGLRVRRLTPQGEVRTEWLAGWGLYNAVEPIFPTALAAAADGALYIADSTRIWRRAPNAAAELLAGGAALGDGAGTAAGFASISGLALGSDGTLYVSEGRPGLSPSPASNAHCVRKLATSGPTRGVVTTLAGPCASGGLGQYGAVDGSGAAARFYNPGGLAVDSDGTVYVADSNNRRIRSITPAGQVRTLTGQASPAFPSPVPGSSGGTLTSAQFFLPTTVAVVAPGFVAVGDGATLWIVAPAQDRVAVWAGSFSGSNDGVGAAASFSTVASVVADGAGGVLVADSGSGVVEAVSPARNAGLLYNKNAGNGLLRQVAADGTVTTRAGRVERVGANNGSGSAALFNRPFGVVADASGNVYVADTGNHVIRRIDRFGLVSTLAGLAGVPGADKGTGTAARFREPRALALAADGSLWVADHGNHLIRRVAANGAVTTVAGSAGVEGSADGTGGSGGTARFRFPAGVAALPGGDVVVADITGLRRVKADGSTRTVAPGSVPGLVAVAADAAGVIYVATRWQEVLKVSNNGTVSPLASRGVFHVGWAHGDGLPGDASFADITALAVDGSGRLLVADGLAQTIRRVDSNGGVTTVLGVSDHDLVQLGSGGYLVSVGGVRLNSPRLGYAAGVAVLPDGRLAVTSENGVFVATLP